MSAVHFSGLKAIMGAVHFGRVIAIMAKLMLAQCSHGLSTFYDGNRVG